MGIVSEQELRLGIVIAEMALKRGFVTQEQIDEARGHAETPLHLALLERRFITSEQLDEIMNELSATVRAVTEKASSATRRLDDTLPQDVRASLEDSRRDIGKFVLVKRLGKGGFGEVWRAWEKELRRYVAIKFIQVATEEDKMRLTREAQVAAKLEHPCIVHVYEVGDSRMGSYISMKLIDGVTLEKASLSIRQKLMAIRDAAVAIHFANVTGIVHRDIKPANILTEFDSAASSKSGSAAKQVEPAAKIYVTDFGLAKQQAVETSISVSGNVVGTPAYMPPEQARGKSREIDARSDVYSLGATLYHIITGIPPFQGDEAVAILQEVIASDPVPPTRFVPKLPKEIETMIMKCLEKEKVKRYQSAQELADDLQRFLDGEPISAQPVPLVSKIARKAIKHKAVVIPSTIAVLVGLGFLGWLIYGWTRPGYLKIDAGNSGAQILIDKIPAQGSDFELSPGTHLVEARLQNHYDFSQIVNVERNKSQEIQISMRRHEGVLSVEAEPQGAVAVIAGVSHGTPLRQLKLPTGLHHIRVEMPECYVREFDVRIDLEREATVHAYLPKAVVWHKEVTDLFSGKQCDDYDGDGSPDFSAAYYSNIRMLIFSSATGETQDLDVAEKINALHRWADLNGDGKREFLSFGLKKGKNTASAYDFAARKYLWTAAEPTPGAWNLFSAVNDLLVDFDVDGTVDWLLGGTLAVSGSTGKELWSRPVTERVVAVAPVRDAVFILTDKTLTKHGNDGAELWSVNIQNGRGLAGWKGSALVLTDDSVIKIDALEGEEVWRTSCAKNSGTCVQPGDYFFLWTENSVAALDVKDGKISPNVDFGFKVIELRPVKFRGKWLALAVGESLKEIALADPESKILWKHSVKSKPESKTLLIDSDLLFFAGERLEVLALDGGRSILDIPVSSPICSTLNYADVDGHGKKEIIAGMNNGDISGISLEGKILWTIVMPHLPRDISVLDIDSDGLLDMYVAGHGVSRVSGPKLLWQAQLRNGLRGKPALLDADGDGLPDAAIASEFPKTGRGIRCYSGRDGHVIWENHIDHDMIKEMVTVEAGGRKNLLALIRTSFQWLDGSTGKSIRKVSFEKIPYGYSEPFLADVDRDGIADLVHFPWDPASAAVWSGKDGKMLWKIPTYVTVWTHPAFDSGDLLYLTRSGTAYRVKGSNGTVVWKKTLGTDSHCGIVLGNGAGYTITEDENALHCFDPATGKVQWSLKSAAYSSSIPALADVDGDGTQEIFVGGAGVLCVNANGTAKWRSPNFGQVTPPVVVDDLESDGKPEVICCTNKGEVYCLDARDGKVLWRYSTGTNLLIEAGPVVADFDGDGIKDVIFGGYDQKLTCISGRSRDPDR